MSLKYINCILHKILMALRLFTRTVLLSLSGGVLCWRGYLSEARCRLAHDPADATATHCLLLQ